MGGDAMFSGTFLQRISTWRGEFLIGKSWDSQEGFERRDFHRSRTEAQWFLQDLLSDSFAVMALRDVLGGTETTLDLSRLSDHDVVDRLASKIASGRLAVFERDPWASRQEKPVGKSLPLERPSSIPNWEPEPTIWGAGGGAQAVCSPAELTKEPESIPEQPKPEAKVISIQWNTVEAYCSDIVVVSGTTFEYQDGSKVQVDIRKQGGGVLTSKQITVKGNAFQTAWPITEILPEKAAGHFLKEMELEAVASGHVSPKPLKVHFVTNAKKGKCITDYGRFLISIQEHEVNIEGPLNYMQGWGGEVVNLGKRVAAATGGLIVGFPWPGYRWMKTVGGIKHYWNGSAWCHLPARFRLRDRNSFAVGFYQSGNSFVCQDGGTWPEPFPGWDITLAEHQKKINAWSDCIANTWTGKFDLKRIECKSNGHSCCRYRIRVTGNFERKQNFSAEYLIISAGDIRSNSALFFLGDPDVVMAAHEFGHHLGNRDEYDGAETVNPRVNGDGAVRGIDDDSIMGSRMTKVKKRHLATVAGYMASLVKTELGKPLTYKVVDP